MTVADTSVENTFYYCIASICQPWSACKFQLFNCNLGHQAHCWGRRRSAAAVRAAATASSASPSSAKGTRGRCHVLGHRSQNPWRSPEPQISHLVSNQLQSRGKELPDILTTPSLPLNTMVPSFGTTELLLTTFVYPPHQVGRRLPYPQLMSRILSPISSSRPGSSLPSNLKRQRMMMTHHLTQLARPRCLAPPRTRRLMHLTRSCHPSWGSRMNR